MLAKKIQAAAFIDLDEELQTRLRATVADIVAVEGWDGFRAREHDLLKAVIAETEGKTVVISTGGGIILLPENRSLLKQSGLCFLLSVPVSVIAQRLSSAPNASQRPSLTGKSLLEELEEVMLARAPLYAEAADIVLDAEQSPQHICEEAVRHLEAIK